MITDIKLAEPPYEMIERIQDMMVKDGHGKAKVRLEAGQNDMFLMYKECYANLVSPEHEDYLRALFWFAWPYAEKWVRQWIENEASKERAEEGLSILARRMKAMREGK